MKKVFNLHFYIFWYFADKYTEDNRDSSFSESDEDVKKVKPSLQISTSQVSTPSVEDVIENINPAYRYIEEVEEHKK